MAAGPGQIIGELENSSTGGPYIAQVGSDGRLWVDVGGDIVISGVTIDNVVIQEMPPTDVTKNNALKQMTYISSGAGTGLTIGSAISQVVQFIGPGSYVKTLTYSNNNLTSIGSWV